MFCLSTLLNFSNKGGIGKFFMCQFKTDSNIADLQCLSLHVKYKPIQKCFVVVKVTGLSELR